MSYDTIRSSTSGAVTTITLDRPDQLNAWTPHMAEELADAIGRANDDPAVGAIIMTGAGRGFCAGADMNAVFGTRLSGTDPGNDTAGGSGGMPAGIDWVQLIRDSKPVVAAIHGAADGIVATVDAKIGVVFIKVGLVPELASTHFLVQRVGWGPASDLCLTGRIVRGDEAAALRLVDHVVDNHDGLIAKATELAEAFAASPTPQARMVKRLLTVNGADTDLHAVQRLESQLLAECWSTPEHAEAVAAFTEKRPPQFR